MLKLIGLLVIIAIVSGTLFWNKDGSMGINSRNGSKVISDTSDFGSTAFKKGKEMYEGSTAEEAVK